jgi:hypothetical protein
VLLGLLGLAGYGFGPALVHFARDEAVLVVAADDRNVEVTVPHAGGPLVVLPLGRGTRTELLLPQGEYEVRIREKDGPRSAAQAVALRRGGREVLHAGEALERSTPLTPFHFRNDRYEATVEADGCLTSLRVGGVEFLAPGVNISRGAYFFDDKFGGVLALPVVERPAPDVITARGDRAAVRYEFDPESLTCEVTNTTDHQVLAVSPDGHYSGTPAAESQLLYVVETDRGQDLLSPEEFARKSSWKNDPDLVRPAPPAAPGAAK